MQVAMLRCIAFLLCATVVGAQSPPASPRPVQKDAPYGMPAFEEASVTPGDTGLEPHFEIPARDRFTVTNTTLLELLGFAYGVEHARLLGGPDWLGVERFDIVAKAGHPLPAWSGSGPPVQLLLMVRTLLADRFGLVVHQETRELPAYALLVARDDRKFGPEITASKLTCDDSVGTGIAPAPAGGGASRCDTLISAGRIVVRGRGMAQFATVLSSVVHRVVIDRTQLPGTFDFRLTWTPDPSNQPLAAALQEQLGLTLESTHAPLEVLVIDRVEHPVPD
jgi:uncharacterized protein (TIGR03435 family)